jgi:hypothetical protein
VRRGSSGREFFRRWVRWTVAGEAVGFAVAAATGAIVATQGIGGWLAFALMLGAGAIEGALLGTGQAGSDEEVAAAVSHTSWLAPGHERRGRCRLVDRHAAKFSSEHPVVESGDLDSRGSSRLRAAAFHPNGAIPRASHIPAHCMALDTRQRVGMGARRGLDYRAVAPG